MSKVGYFNKKLIAPAVVAIAALMAGPALAQSTLEEVAQYQGADRMERLIAAAKAEGSLTLYTATPVGDVTAITKAFEETYGIPVTVWRGAADEVLRRVITETQAGRYDVDVVETNAPELEILHREGILQAIASPTIAEIFPGAVPEHGEWVGSRLNPVTAAYNTNLVSADEAPKTWQDLLKPEWKGKLAIEAEAYDWLEAMVNSFPSRDEGLAYFTELAKVNGLSPRAGHSLLTNMTIAGEVPFALTVYGYACDAAKADGAPIECLNLGPTFGRPNGLAVAKTTTHPNAAVLYFEFTLNQAQAILASRHMTPTNTVSNPAILTKDITLLGGANTIDNMAAWRETFQSIVKVE